MGEFSSELKLKLRPLSQNILLDTYSAIIGVKIELSAYVEYST